MYPEEGVSKDGQQQGNRNQFAAAPVFQTAPAPRHFINFLPGFARKRPIRAVLLATAMVAVSFSLVRHHDHGPAQANAQISAQSSSSAAGDTSSDPWNPPVGIDRSNAALDRLTFDLASPPQTFYPVPGFQAAQPHLVSLPAEPAPQHADAVQPVAKATQQQAFLALPPAVDVEDVPSREAPASSADVPDPPAAPSASAPASHAPRKVHWREEIDGYLWSVYQRSATKRDASGDFTWKDEAAAAKMGLVIKQYVIGGIDPDFRELLYNIGHAMDADGIHWTILSGFRDDYRQGLASGYKAHVGNSFHGGSRATGGYGHGCAADIEASSGEGSSNNAVWRWVDQHGEKFGIFRPMKQIDPAHIQPFGAWHDVAVNLRTKEVQNAYLPASIDSAEAGRPPLTSLVETRSGVSESQFDCVRSHGGHFRLASHHGFPGSHMHKAVLFHGGRLHRFGRRRMIVIIGGGEKHASADTVLVADQNGADAKAEASGRNRRDTKTSDTKTSDAKSSDAKSSNTKPHNVAADAGHAEKNARKEASLSAERTRHRAKAADAKSSETKPSEAKAQKTQVAKAEVAKAQVVKTQAKSQETKTPKVADSKHPQKHADAKASESKAKSRVADHQDASSKKL
jgi:hypothetical protein